MATVTLTFRLPAEMAAQIRDNAAAAGQTLNQYLADMATAALAGQPLQGTALPEPDTALADYASALQLWCKQTIRLARNTGAAGLLAALPQLPTPPAHV